MKKIILLAGAAALAFAFKDQIFGKSADGATVPVASGDNFTQRELTDAEALSYLNNNSDLLATFGAGNIAQAKWHFQIQGYLENRTM